MTVWRRGTDRLRASLSLRTALALAVGALVVLLVFTVVISSQLRAQVFADRRDTILADAALRLSSAQSIFDQSTASTVDQVQDSARQVLQSIRSSAAGAGAVSVMLLRAPDNDGELRINEIATSSTRALLTTAMREHVREGSQAWWQSVGIVDEEGGSRTPGILVGMTVQMPRAGTHELYILYSLAADQSMIDMTMRVLAIAAVPILIALPLAVFWALFHLLAPVRRTAAAATRLARGDLEARVPVSGHDEMASLGTAFNDMASSLEHQISEYDELSRLQQRFVSDVSHELRTPLTTIRMAEEMIWDERDRLSQPGRRSAELLHGQVERFESMLADLLELSRHDARRSQVETEPVDLRTVVAKVVEANADLAERIGVEVRVHAPAHRCVAEIDVLRVERVLRNLVVNAVEHAEGGPVDVTVASNDAVSAVRVRDHGVGMDEATAERVFDRFFRADPARARTTGGTGLGLSIAQEDVRLHHGRLSAWGELGRGASFLAEFPRCRGTDLAAEDSPRGPLELWEEDA